jgi:hypothetical protein
MSAAEAVAYVVINEWDDVLLDFAASIWDAFAEAGSSVWSLAERVWDDGILAAVENAWEDATEAGEDLLELPEQVAEAVEFAYNEFSRQLDRLSPEDLAIYLGRVACYVAVWSGGAVVGYGLPDKDIVLLGIGSHRNFAFHSVVPTVGVKLLGSLFLRVLGRAARRVRRKDERAVLAFVASNLVVATGGVSAGVGVHLLEDALLDGNKSVVGPWGSTIVAGTSVDDNAWFLVNGFCCLLNGESPQRRRRKTKKKASKVRRRTAGPARRKARARRKA